MIPVFPSIFRHGPTIVLFAVSVALVLCAAVLLASVASGAFVAAPPPSDGPLLAPFRWGPSLHGLA